MDNYDLDVINAKQFLNTAAVAGYVQNQIKIPRTTEQSFRYRDYVINPLRIKLDLLGIFGGKSGN